MCREAALVCWHLGSVEEQCTSRRCWVFVFLEKNEPLQQCQRTPGVLYNEVSAPVGAMFG